MEIIEICQNTQKSPLWYKKTCHLSDFSKNLVANADVKKSQDVKSCQEKEEEDSTGQEIVWMHQHEDSMSTLKRTKKDKLQRLETAQPT